MSTKSKTNVCFIIILQSLSHVRFLATPWTAAQQASLSITNSQSLLKLMFTQVVMPPNHLVFCRPLLLLPSILPSIRTSLVAQLVKNLLQCGRPGFDPWVGKIPWRRAWQPTPAFCSRESHRLYSPWGCKELDMTERDFYFHFVIISLVQHVFKNSFLEVIRKIQKLSVLQQVIFTYPFSHKETAKRL